ncbi:hypothetical protein ACFX2K_032633 [Malus domestica]
MVLGVFGCDFGFRRELGWYGGAARSGDGVWRCRMVARGVEWCMEVDEGCGKDGNWLEWMMVAAAKGGERVMDDL